MIVTRILVKKTPVLPRDAMANFLYYGQSEITDDVRVAILLTGVRLR